MYWNALCWNKWLISSVVKFVFFFPAHWKYDYEGLLYLFHCLQCLLLWHLFEPCTTCFHALCKYIKTNVRCCSLSLSLSPFKKTANCNHFTEVSCMSMRIINQSFRDILDVTNNCASACDNNNNEIILRKCHSLTRVKLIVLYKKIMTKISFAYISTNKILSIVLV